jgi:hypothetical protein
MVVRSRGRFAGAGVVAVALAGCGVTPVAPNVDIPGISNPDVGSHLAVRIWDKRFQCFNDEQVI